MTRFAYSFGPESITGSPPNWKSKTQRKRKVLQVRTRRPHTIYVPYTRLGDKKAFMAKQKEKERKTKKEKDLLRIIKKEKAKAKQFQVRKQNQKEK